MQQSEVKPAILAILALSLMVAAVVGSSGCFSEAKTVITTPEPRENLLINDSTGTRVVLTSQPQRIICQNGDAAELLIALGAGDRIVGVVRTTEEDPVLMQHMPNARSVSDWQTPNIEQILALKPDVILTYSTPMKNTDQMIAANLTLIPVDSYKIPDLNRDAAALGILTGADANVSQYTAFNDRYLTLVKKRVAERSNQKPLRVYVEGYGDYSVHAKGSGGDLLLKILKATNIAGSINTSSAKVSPEWVIDQNPDVIIKIAMDPVKYESLEKVREKILHREGFSEIQAVQRGNVYVLNGDVISSPRGIVGVLYAAKALYPDEFDDVNPNLVLEEYAREFVSGTDQIQTFYPML
jgi:iron complex transport system substrate-binding protein